MSQSYKLTKDPIWLLLRRVTIPASVGSLFQTFYNLVDTWFAGKISAEAIGAIAKSFPIYFTIIAVGVGIGAATNSLIGNSIGSNDIRGLNDSMNSTNNPIIRSNGDTLDPFGIDYD